MITFSTSMMVANPFRLESDIKTIDFHTDMYHIDLMDGHYVPNIAQSLDFVHQLKPFSTKPIEAHLMVEKAEKYIDQLINSGVHTLVFHPETLTSDIREVQAKCARHGVRFGLAINPDQSLTDIAPMLTQLDVLTVMMVYPGFAGQSMVEKALDTLQDAAQFKADNRASYVIEIDGSNNFKTFERYVRLGAERLILGSGLFGYDDLNEGYAAIKSFVRDLT